MVISCDTPTHVEQQLLFLSGLYLILILPIRCLLLQSINMPPVTPTPQWVKDLKPSGPQGSELLARERANSNIPVEQLSKFLFTQEGLDQKRGILKILQSEKVFDKSQNYFAGRVDRFETALARAKKLRQLQVKHKWESEDKQVANELISEPGPYGLHESMFLVRVPVLE